MTWDRKGWTFGDEMQFLNGMVTKHRLRHHSYQVNAYCDDTGVGKCRSLRGYIKSIKKRKKWGFRISKSQKQELRLHAEELLKREIDKYTGEQ